MIRAFRTVMRGASAWVAFMTAMRRLPAQLVASNADTSVRMLSLVYARYVSHYGDDVARRALLTAAPSAVAAE